MSRISPIRVGNLVLTPIRHFFKNNAPEQFRWDVDPKNSKIDISMINDANKELVDHDMQILVDRGGFQVNKTGLSDNMSDQKPFGETKGLMDRANFLIYQGQATVIVKSRNEGNVEVLADMVMHVLQWSRPHICDVLGFKEFALPMTVSEPALGKIDTEVFQVSISVPYLIEERWTSANDALRMRDVFVNLRETLK